MKEVEVETTAEQEQRARVQRYQALVEQKRLQGLTPEQSEEVERLGQEIDRYYDWFYNPIIERLKAKLQERSGGR